MNPAEKAGFFLKMISENLGYSRNFTTFAMSSKNALNKYKVKEVIKMLEDDGWFLLTIKGDHRQFKHPSKKGKVTVRGKPSETVSQFLLNSIWKQAGWR